MKKFFNEFKAFIAKGDVMSMAVGIIIGGAFTAIVNALVNDVITPLLGIILGGIDFTGIIIQVGSAQLMVGNFIQAIITFLLTAFALFLILKTFNAFKKKEEEKTAAPAEPPAPPADVQLLTEIRDLLKNK
jgi:large conductance mechanosensitive channel